MDFHLRTTLILDAIIYNFVTVAFCTRGLNAVLRLLTYSVDTTVRIIVSRNKLIKPDGHTDVGDKTTDCGSAAAD